MQPIAPIAAVSPSAFQYPYGSYRRAYLLASGNCPGRLLPSSAYAHTTTDASVTPPSSAGQARGAIRAHTAAAANTAANASSRSASRQLASGCTDHTIEIAVSAANAPSSTTGHSPYAGEEPRSVSAANASTSPETSVSAISVAVIDSRFRPPFA